MNNPHPQHQHYSANGRARLKQNVASLLARGLAEHEIVTLLAQPFSSGDDDNPFYTLNPVSQKPYSQPTVNRIIKELFADWQAENMAKMRELQAKLFIENTEVRRAAWAAGDLGQVASSLDQMARWIGANKPLQIEDVTDDRLSALIEQTLEELASLKAGTNAPGAEPPYSGDPSNSKD